MIDSFHFPKNSDMEFRLLIPKIKKPQGPSLLERIEAKIEEFIKKLMKMFKRMRHSFPALTQKQVRLINKLTTASSVRPFPKATVIAPPKNVQFEPIPTRATSPLANPNEPVLDKFCRFVNDFSAILGTCIYENKVKDLTENWKKLALNGIDGIKDGLEIVYNIQKSITSLLKLIGISDLEDPTSTILAQQLLQIFLLPSDQRANPRESIEKDLKAKIKTLGKENKISHEQTIHILQKIPKILNWLFKSNNWLLNSNYPIQLHHFFLDCAKFIESLYTLFSNDAFDGEIDAIRQIIDDSFEEDIKAFLELNAESVSQFFAVRISKLIENLAFPDMMNDILNKFLTHLKGIIAANKPYDDVVDLLSASEKAIAARTRTGKEGANQEEAQKLINLVKKPGGIAKDDFSSEKYLKAKQIYLDKQLDEAFSKHTACHPIAAADTHDMDESTKLKHEETYYGKLINKLYPSLLPQEKITLPNGLEMEIDGLVALFDQIKLPKRWEQIRGLGKRIINRVIKEGKFNNAGNFKTYTKTLGTILSIALIRDKMDILLIKGLRDSMNSFCSPNLWEYVIANLVFPSQLESGFKEWTKDAISRNIKKVSKYFHGMIDKTNDHFVFSKPNDHLLSYLYKLMKSEAIDFDLEKGGITKKKFKELIQPLIDEIKNHLNENIEKSNLSKKVFEAELKNYFTEEKAPVNKVFGDLCKALLVDIANFGNQFTQFAVKMAKGLISEEASQSMHKFTKSYHLAISSLIDGGSKHLLNKEVMNKMMFPVIPLETTVQKIKPITQKTFTANLHQLSLLWHDSLYRKIGVVTPSSQELETITSEIFKKLIHRPIMNKSLMLQNIDIISNYFEKAAATNNSTGHKVTRPSRQKPGRDNLATKPGRDDLATFFRTKKGDKS